MWEFIFAGVKIFFFADGPESFFAGIYFHELLLFTAKRLKFLPAKISSNKVHISEFQPLPSKLYSSVFTVASYIFFTVFIIYNHVNIYNQVNI